MSLTTFGSFYEGATKTTNKPNDVLNLLDYLTWERIRYNSIYLKKTQFKASFALVIVNFNKIPWLVLRSNALQRLEIMSSDIRLASSKCERTSVCHPGHQIQLIAKRFCCTSEVNMRETFAWKLLFICNCESNCFNEGNLYFPE